MNKIRLSQQGITLIEVLLALIITGILISFTVNYFLHQTQLHTQTTQVATQIRQIADISYEWQTAQQQADFKDISINALQKATLLSNDHYNTTLPWNGTFSISADKSDAKYLSITLSGIPLGACNLLITQMRTVAHRQSSHQECKTDGYYYISL